MYTTREAFQNHLRASGLFQTVKPLTGDLKEAIRDTVKLPAAFVVWKDITLTDRSNQTIHFFVADEDRGLDLQDGATEALKVVEDAVTYLQDKHFWSEAGYTYQIKVQEGIEARLGRLKNAYTLFVVSVPVEQFED